MKNGLTMLAGGTLLFGALSPVSAETPTFNKDIRPILSENCYHCHGPDEAQQQGRLSLHHFEGATARVIVPGDAAKSRLMERVTTDDPLDLMPPPESNRHLTPEQIETLRAWIDSGAEYEEHWAFIAPKQPSVPETADSSWVRNEIDAFVLARLEAEGLAPSPEADKAALLRRVSLDLTGLPPTLAELEAFESDDAPDAYEQVVERLLASPAYGERMANDWLDAARYADTYGYQSDVEKKVWPWRDWVIEAFNANKPYDEFAREQLAGDLLENPTQDQRLATLFNRLHRQTNEGGSILEEMRLEYVADRVNTFGTAFLGLTMDCARCHDHKYDPISHYDYFAMSSFFSNIDESGMYSHFTDAVPTPSMFLYREGEEERHEDLRKSVVGLERWAERTQRQARERFAEWLMKEDRSFPAPTPIAHLPLDEIIEGKTPEIIGEVNGAIMESAPEVVPGILGNALKFTGDNGIEVEGVGNFDRTQPFTVSFWLNAPEIVPHQVVLHHTRAREDAGSRGWAVLLQDGKPTFTLAHFWPGNALQVQSNTALSEGEWYHLAVSYDGSSRAEGMAIFIDGEPAPLTVERDNLYKDITYAGNGPKGLTLGARFRDVGFAGGQLDDIKLYDRVLSAHEVAVVAAEAPIDAVGDDDAGFEYYLRAIDADWWDVQSRLQAARSEKNAFVAGLFEIMTMEEMDEPRPTFLLDRGAYDAPTVQVTARTPESVLPFPEDLPRNRLGLAEWLLSDENPLAARVAVNRYWQLFFGRGLVATPEDFGSQGAWPTHPDLLDWLAVSFRESGWDLKELHRMIVTSATYRQENRANRELLERDPFNELLARGPRHRLSAEQIRDQALAASGLLVDRLGGPSVKPYQPDGLWEDASSKPYVQDTGEALYRRGMYTFWKRTVPPPTMLTFDAVTREVCVVNRETTQTPLQALALMNDPTFVEAARMLAEQLMQNGNDAQGRIVAAFRGFTGMNPDERELAILMAAFDEQRAYFAERPEAAAAYVSTGEHPRDESLDAVTHAALTAIIQAIMNHDHAQVKS